ncbi:methyltransferase family protein [Pseudooctadecabacter jejudonensis]|uniref:Isoprenylcysteine carboxyl methyltransferase (ICMT) family protein n=1 Tax=Pseudooctadecabacter jejudonensis TaxID=1391910 RepID=A0A1Y5RLY9_9RHOB|nr:isoprenylcysteine carboxylmethyltransferase family protein [Pseudooctadecabacter jejudonensis]SLN19484.1 hypothetical protein PSJ8397_00687 [Pseudooctadecabacter jejudonensis]
MKWLDLPPFWLLGCLVATYWIGGAGAGQGAGPTGVSQTLAGVLAVVGFGLMGAAVFEMRRHKTTFIPHLTAQTLVQSGVFSISRNPIYLGDILVLLAYIIWTQTWLALPLVGGLFWVLTSRFIRPEEACLRAAFGREADIYMQKTRRWL